VLLSMVTEFGTAIYRFAEEISVNTLSWQQKILNIHVYLNILLFGFGTNCRLMSLCYLPSRPSSLDWQASRRLRRQSRNIRPVFISHSGTFLSVCGTWIYCLLPALHAHLPCTTLLNCEECALLEKEEK